ncbi:DUF7561 family protein [Natronorubrum sulfidifaciens]|uniref:Small CPxCG-related zinc finger protein n=1 Tax=Natronorubrum sulfidifaciens JCM 14089 TaxID=1230460 RepID=L9WB73_9EURY|nr:hypothetical protein [Natronorubrum sulfidifaciens]ELY46755.1 hypothetical protein C495_06593 [Natronorubrum sulfidifaciens JCM 14089]
MANDSCDGCGRPVTVTGGIANLWTFGEGSEGTAMTLELADGTSHLLCYPCIEALPDEGEPTAAVIERLEQVDEETSRLGVM